MHRDALGVAGGDWRLDPARPHLLTRVSFANISPYCMRAQHMLGLQHNPTERRPMMPPRNTRTTHPAISPQVEQMLAARNIDYDFEPNVRVSEIRDTEGNQVRFREHRATKDQVQKYATAM